MPQRNSIWCLALVVAVLALAAALTASGCAPANTPTPIPTPASRQTAIPAGAVKVAPADDPWPPVATAGWSQPVPLGAPVNTAGAEDSPFITSDGQTLYFFFTPDVQVPAEKQLFDGVTGIWIAQRAGESWTGPTWVNLAEP
ncbi:MAG: hypothetical protein KJ734_04960, partial [Chloroflexi bacterium]|nr:hypothetical protein [Chloroflexota bacterium]